MDALKTLLAQISAFWASKDKRFKRTAIIIASSVLVVVVVASILLNQVNYATLYAGLNPEDSSAVIQTLSEQKVNYRVSGDAIMVPAADADRLRMSLSTEVKNGFNLDILKQGQGLGMTEADKRDYRKAQLQYDLQNAIKTLTGVRDAQVQLTIPEDSPLVIASNRQEATAGVILSLQEDVELDAKQVRAIALFVQKAVPSLKMDNISIMDSEMQNLDTSGETNKQETAKDHFALQYDVQSKLRKQILALLQPVFGLGRVEAQVGVTLDFDTRTTDTVKFEPVTDDGNGIVVSIDKLREQIVNGAEPAASGEPGTDTNTGTPEYPVVNVDNGTYEKNAEKINYEINSIKDHLEQAEGAIKTLSVAVVIDSTGAKEGEDITGNVKSLVAKAVGVSEDLVSVQALPMAGTQAEVDAAARNDELSAAKYKDQQMRFYIIIGAAVLVVMVAMMLVFMNKRAKERAVLAQQNAVLAAEAAVGMAEEMEPMGDMEPALADIEIVKDSSTKEQIGKLIEKNPELVANLLRSWLADEQE